MNFGRTVILLSILAAALLAALLWIRGRPEGAGDGEPLLFYCAAGSKPPVLAAAERFEKEYGVRIRLQYGGSGTLLSNIQVARQGDLYLAADRSYMEIAREKGLIAETLPLAWQRPVIAVRRGNPKGIRGLDDLLRPGVRVALGNPEAASIGKQTRLLLEAAGRWKALERRVRESGVFKPTVGDVAVDVKIGAVDAGVIWDNTAAQFPELACVRVPLFESARKQIAVAVLNSCRRPAAALRFARFLNSREGNAIFRAEGYDPVQGDRWAWRPEITFYCGSVNRRAVEETVRRFAEREGVTVDTVYNGCGILTAQMRTIRRRENGGGGGFPDVYMACDRYYLDTVADWFQEDADVSETDIVIAVPKGNPAGIRSLADLARPGVRVAVGQPDQCTIGVLTRALLREEGLLERVMANVVMQTASSSMLVPTVTTRSVDAALAYATDTLAEADRIDSVRIDSPRALAVQPFGIARSSEYKYLDRRLFRAVVAARERFERAGFRFRAEGAVTEGGGR